MNSGWRLLHGQSGEVLVKELSLAISFQSRLRGLQFSAPLHPTQGLLLAPCASIHTCFMRFSLDIVFLDVQGMVLGFRGQVPPWRLVTAPKKTWAILETRAGSLALPLPQRVHLHPAGDKPRLLPRSLASWVNPVVSASLLTRPRSSVFTSGSLA